MSCQVPLLVGVEVGIIVGSVHLEYTLIPVNIHKLQRDMLRRFKDRMTWMCACGRFNVHDHLPSIIHTRNTCCGEVQKLVQSNSNSSHQNNAQDWSHYGEDHEIQKEWKHPWRWVEEVAWMSVVVVHGSCKSTCFWVMMVESLC